MGMLDKLTVHVRSPALQVATAAQSTVHACVRAYVRLP